MAYSMSVCRRGLLKQWKQGNTLFGKTIKRSLEIGVFFLPNFFEQILKFKKIKGHLFAPFESYALII